MVSIRKRRYDGQEENADSSQSSGPPSMLVRLRNMWQFASLYQWVYIFGGVVKLDNLDIEELEAKCLSPHPTILQDIGLALLKFLSSHRGLTYELFDEYTRRQYMSKAPELPNPFGSSEVPIKFSDFTVFQQVRILHQMTLFIMMNPEKLREKMAEQKDADRDQTTWRIEPFGWDRYDRAYYVLDDNRVYRLVETPLPPSKKKNNTKNARAQATRNSKRYRIMPGASSGTTVGGIENDGMRSDDEKHFCSIEGESGELGSADFGGMVWECIAVSLDDLHALLATIPGKKDPNERILHEKIVRHLLPILEQQEERRKRRERERDRELLNLAKMANAKRSSRIANRQEQRKQDEIRREEEQKQIRELDALRKEEQKRRKMERERDNRLLSRQNRLRDRKARRAEHEKELAQLSENKENPEHVFGHMSERRRLAEIQRNKKALQDLDDECEEEWTFDCICGLHGKVDDGQHSISCEKCNIWQHSRCLHIDEGEAEKDDFHFVCKSCSHQIEEMPTKGRSTSRPLIKIKINRPITGAGNNLESSELLATTHVEAPRCETSIGRVSDHIEANIDAGIIPPQKAIPSAPALLMKSPIIGKTDRNDQHGTCLPSIINPLQASGTNIPPVRIHDKVAFQSQASAESLKMESALIQQKSQDGHTDFASLPQPDLTRPALSPRKSHVGTTHVQYANVSNISSLPQVQVHLGSPAATPSVHKSSAQLPHTQLTPTSFTTPRLHHLVSPSEPSSSPLLPLGGGVSPTKHSPTVIKDQSGGLSGASPTQPILPPTAALSPSAPMQILTPPIKPGGLAHRQPFSSMVSNTVSIHDVEE